MYLRSPSIIALWPAIFPGLGHLLLSKYIRGIPLFLREIFIKRAILAVPLDKRREDRLLFNRTHYADGLSMIDFPVILAALFSLFGMIYGFVMR